MEALVPAFIAALLAQAGDRSAWLTAILADRYRRPFTVALAAVIGHGIGNAVAAAGAAAIAPMMGGDARNLLLALALVLAALGALWRVKPPERLDGWRLGAFGTSVTGVFILALGDATQFLTFAFAMRAPSPWFAFAGTIAGVAVVSVAAATIGEAGWRRLPLRGIRIGFALLTLGIGAVIGAGALRLI